MVGIAAHVGDHTAALDDSDPAGVKTVAWTGGSDDFLGVRHRVSPIVPRVIGRSPHSTMLSPDYALSIISPFRLVRKVINWYQARK